MFEIGALVSYGTNGVCKISDKRNDNMSGTDREYYVLTPLGSRGASIFVPADNEKLVAKMRRLLSREEIANLISAACDNDIQWERDNKKRSEYGNEVIARGDRGEMLSLIRCIYLRKKELAAAGKRLPGVDDGILKRAEKLINEEFSVSLGIPSGDVPEFIRSSIENNAEV